MQNKYYKICESLPILVGIFICYNNRTRVCGRGLIMYVTLKEYAELKGLSYGTVRNAVKNKKFIPDYKDDLRWYVDPDKPWYAENKRIKADIPKKDKDRLSNILRGMKQRCYNPNKDCYYIYGGRGITICDEWLNSTTAFVKWAIENGYQDGLEIDRIDNDGNYEPTNCQWITKSENNKKKGKRYYHPNAVIRRKQKFYKKAISEYPELEEKLTPRIPKFPWEE